MTVIENEKTVLRLLEDAGGKLTADDDIVRTDDGTFAVPKSMELSDAVRFLRRKMEEETEATQFDRTYMFRPWDGAIATHRVLKRVFGMVHLGRVGWNAPELKTIDVGVGETEQVPWGSLTIPVLPDVQFYLGETSDSELGQLFQVVAFGPRKDLHAIQGVFNLIQDELEQRSIYRGKAFDGRPMPRFIDVSSVDRNRIVYASGVAEQLTANIWALLRFTEQHRRKGLPLKRAVLLEGPYGTGKTVGATITAQEAVASGWTFISCRPGRDSVDDCMATARLYQPAVVFVEDVDTISDPNELGTDGVARLLDLFDGIDAKDTEILVVMTTNHPEKIHKGMVRPGRLDAVIHIGELDSDGIRRMVTVLIDSDDLAETIDWDAVGESMTGFLPAYVKECCDRAVRYNMARNGGVVTTIDTADLVAAGNGLRPQLELMNGARDSRTVDPLSESMAAVMSGTIAPAVSELSDVVVTESSNVRRQLPGAVRRSLDMVALLDDDGEVQYRIDVDR